MIEDWHLRFDRNLHVCNFEGSEYRPAEPLRLFFEKWPKGPAYYTLRVFESDESRPAFEPSLIQDPAREASKDDQLCELRLRIAKGGELKIFRAEESGSEEVELGEEYDVGRSLEVEFESPVLFDLQIHLPGAKPKVLKNIPIRRDASERKEPGLNWEIGVAVLRKGGRKQEAIRTALVNIAKPEFRSEAFESAEGSRRAYEDAVRAFQRMVPNSQVPQVWATRAVFCSYVKVLAESDLQWAVHDYLKKEKLQEEKEELERKADECDRLLEEMNRAAKKVIDALTDAAFAVDVLKLTQANHHDKRDHMLARMIRGLSACPAGKKYLSEYVLTAYLDVDENRRRNQLWSDCLWDLAERQHHHLPLTEDQEILEAELDATISPIVAKEGWKAPRPRAYLRIQGMESLEAADLRDVAPGDTTLGQSTHEGHAKARSEFLKKPADLVRWGAESIPRIVDLFPKHWKAMADYIEGQKTYEGFRKLAMGEARMLKPYKVNIIVAKPINPRLHAVYERGHHIVHELHHKWMARIQWFNAIVTMILFFEQPDLKHGLDLGGTLCFLAETILHGKHFVMAARWAGVLGCLFEVALGAIYVVKGIKSGDWKKVLLGTLKILGYGLLGTLLAFGITNPWLFAAAFLLIGVYYILSWILSDEEEEADSPAAKRKKVAEELLPLWVRECAPAFADQIRGKSNPKICLALFKDGALDIQASDELRPTTAQFYAAPWKKQIDWTVRWISWNTDVLSQMLDFAYGEEAKIAKENPGLRWGKSSAEYDEDDRTKDSSDYPPGQGGCSRIGDGGTYSVKGTVHTVNGPASGGKIVADNGAGLIKEVSVGPDGSYEIPSLNGETWGYGSVELTAYDESGIQYGSTVINLGDHPSLQVTGEEGYRQGTVTQDIGP